MGRPLSQPDLSEHPHGDPGGIWPPGHVRAELNVLQRGQGGEWRIGARRARKRTGYTHTSAGGAPPLWTIVVGPGTPHDVILVQSYRVSPGVTAQNIDAFASYEESTFRHSGVAMQGTPQKITRAGLPGLRFRVTGTAEGTRYVSTGVFAFNGTTEYFVNCQSTAGMAAQVGRACGQVTGSFHLSGAVPGATATAASP